MKKLSALLASIVLTILLPTALISAQEELVIEVAARKSVVEVTAAGWMLTRLEVTNNGPIPIFRLEIYEYFNMLFELGENVTIMYGDREITRSIPAASGNQFILEITDPLELKVGESIEMTYWARSPASGDFQVPHSIVWYSYTYKDNLLRTNVFSNGLLVHVKNDLERSLDRIFPYVISGTAFAIILLVLNYLRRNLSMAVEKVKEKRLFRYSREARLLSPASPRAAWSS